MRKIFNLIMIVFLLCSAEHTYAQDNSGEVIKYSVRNHFLKNSHSTAPAYPTDSLTSQSHFYIAGQRLKQSANYQFAALGCIATGGVMLACYDSRKDSSEILMAGVIFCGVATLFFEYKAIDLKWKAGRELQIGAGSIVYKF